MIHFPVSEEKARELRERMAAAGVREEDLEETFIRSSGSGGQHVNKSATCVRLRHIPTGAEVKCMKERSQGLNRFFARRELLEKLEALPGKASAETEKARRQKAKRRSRARKKYDRPEEGS